MTGPRLTKQAVESAVKRARLAHEAASAEERDRLLSLPAAERLAALDDPGVRDGLTEEDRATVLRSLTLALGGSAQGSPQPQPPAPQPQQPARDLWAEEIAREERNRQIRSVIQGVAAYAAGMGGAWLLQGWGLSLLPPRWSLLAPVILAVGVLGCAWRAGVAEYSDDAARWCAGSLAFGLAWAVLLY